MNRYLGLDLGGTRMRAALAHESGAILRRAEVLTRREGAVVIGEQVCALAAEVIGSEPVQGIGVGAPGPLDARTGVLYHPANFSPD
ncbi:MAG TPA: ROK family protein, partial [Chloroflexota bacterium]